MPLTTGEQGKPKPCNFSCKIIIQFFIIFPVSVPTSCVHKHTLDVPMRWVLPSKLYKETFYLNQNFYFILGSAVILHGQILKSSIFHRSKILNQFLLKMYSFEYFLLNESNLLFFCSICLNEATS